MSSLIVNEGESYTVSDIETYDEVILGEGAAIIPDTALGYGAVTLTVDGTETSIISGRTYTGAVVLTPVRSLRSENSDWSAFRAAAYIDDNGLNESYSATSAVVSGDVSDNEATDAVMRSETDLSSWQESFNGILVNVGTQQSSPQGLTLSDYLNGDISFDYTISNPDIKYTGPGGNDFIGLGAAVMASGNSRVLLQGSLNGEDVANAVALIKTDPSVELSNTYAASINNTGQVRTTLVAEESAAVVIDSAYTKASDGEWIVGYIGSVSPDVMKSVPWMLGLYGNVRANNLLDNATGLYINSIMESENWGVLSTDESESVQVEVQNCVIRGTGVSAYGAYSIGNAEISITDSHIFVPTYAVISANGDNTTEFNNTEIYSGRAGATYHSGSGLVKFTNSEIRMVRELALMRANSTTAFNLLVDNSNVVFTGTEDNILVQLMDNDDVVDESTMLTTVNFTDPAFAYGNNDNSPETARAYYETLSTVTGGQIHNATFNNVSVTGDIYNSSVEYGADLAVVLSGTSLRGVVSSSVGLHEKETLVSVWDSNGQTGSEDYKLLGKLTNYVFPSVGNDTSLSLENGSIWTVTGTSYLTSLSVDSSSTITSEDGYKVSLTIDGTECPLVSRGTRTGSIVLTVTKN